MEKMIRAEEEARRLGISYGVYKGYEATGFLPRFRKIVASREAEKKQIRNVFESNIIGGGRANSGVEHMYSKKVK